LTTVTREAYAFPPDFSTQARRYLQAYSSRGEGGITQAELVDHVAAVVPVPKHQTEAVITRFLAAIMEALHTGKRVELRGFGSVRLRRRQARAGRHPRTGDTVQIPAKPVPGFTAGKAFQELVQTAAVLTNDANNGAARRQTT
jgi:integration host factor subunit beta